MKLHTQTPNPRSWASCWCEASSHAVRLFRSNIVPITPRILLLTRRVTAVFSYLRFIFRVWGCARVKEIHTIYNIFNLFGIFLWFGLHTRIHTHRHTNTYTHMHAHTHTRAHTHMHTHTDTYSHKHTCVGCCLLIGADQGQRPCCVVRRRQK